MNVVGIGGSIHNFATCLIREDSQVFAIEDERLTRVRYALKSPNPCQPSLQYCLNSAGLHLDDIDQIIGNDMLDRIFGSISPRITFINHHLAHAYSTFFTSPFEKAAILVVDGAGSVVSGGTESHERETTTHAWGEGNQVSIISKVIGAKRGASSTNDMTALISNSLGDFYRAITESIGFGFLQAGKTMGLAPYGDDRYVEEVMRYVKLLSEGQFEIVLEGKDGLLQALKRIRQQYIRKEELFAVDTAIAYAGQAVLERVLLHTLDFLHSRVRTSNLCLAGGVALNALFNGKIPSLSKFKNVHVFFAPDDSGTAVGAAIYGLFQNHRRASKKIRIHSGPYWGRRYPRGKMAKALITAGLNYSQPSNLHHKVAQLLSEGLTVAWYQGESEFGPRALGNRSILADPRNANIKDHLNRNIKFREWFRPYGPAVIESAAKNCFEMLCPSPWMQFVWSVKDEFRSLLPGITHVDGSSRVQAVSKVDNPSFCTLLEEFQILSGIPVLLNTSFNSKGEPIVETPSEAIKTFLHTKLDALVLGEFLAAKGR